MSFKQVLIIFLLLLGLIPKTQAQEPSPTKKQDFPFYLSYNNHSWAFPFGSIFRLNPQYPGLTSGIEINYRVRSKSKLFQTFELGGFLNQASGNALYFNSNLAFRYSFVPAIHFDIGLGLGAFNSYRINDIYRLTESGNYISIKDRGVSALSNNLFLSVGYNLSTAFNKELTLYVRYQWIASGAYWDLTTIRPSGLLNIGIRTSLRKN